MPKPGLRPSWVTDPGAGVGILGFYGCHMVDRVLWFVDDKPVEVMATVSTYVDEKNRAGFSATAA
ncbi:MAG: hypothetical protein IAF02_28750 [Anaerolineae bacterium]|nr:hypothetical protein [Anaerolineae bacterium]